MNIRDITIEDVKKGLIWRVVDMEPESMLDWEIVPMGIDEEGEEVVYSGMMVYLKDPDAESQKPLSFIARLFGRKTDLRYMKYPPEYPGELTAEMIPVVELMLIVKDVKMQCLDCFEYIEGGWQQMGLKPNPNAPLIHDYVANPLVCDDYYDACGDDGPIRFINQRAFKEWVAFMD
jgi:hypothetical protein